MNRILLSLPLAAFAVLHCGGAGSGAHSGSVADDAGLGPFEPQDPDAGFTAPGEDASSGAKGDGGCVVGAPDPPDPQGLDTNCDGADGVIGRDVYVSVDLGQDSNPGSPSFPMSTIGAALTAAANTNGNILVSQASSSYPLATVSVTSAWAVYGGYPSTFLGTPNRQTTTLSVPATGLLLQSAPSATLAHLTVQGALPSSPSQPAGHALRTSVGALTLLDVALQAGDGLSITTPAADGDAGAPGVNALGPLVCNGAAQPAYANGSLGDEQSVSGIAPGNFAGMQRALTGAAGLPGTDGADATGALALVNGTVQGDVGRAGGQDGTPGSGSAGGGSGTTAAGETFGGGSGGTGGCPGTGGGGGASGGSSIALLALQGSVSVQGSVLQTGFGGDGAAGGNGGAGGSPGVGGSPTEPGGVPLYPNTICILDNFDPMNHDCAAFGGIGGVGGAGGHGGGGAGGWSIGAVTTGTATVTLDAASNTTLGQAGNGGLGNGGGHAPNGRRLASWHLD